jgi:hypothetical protein
LEGWSEFFFRRHGHVGILKWFLNGAAAGAVAAKTAH